MVSPIYTIAIPLGAAFLLPLFEKVGKNAAKALVLAILGALTALPISWLVVWVVNAPDLAGLLQMSSLVVDTGGFSAPISIRLAAGFGEALVLALVNFTALLGIIHMLARTQAKPTGKTLVLLLTLVTGVNGLILTRDLFNIFVFLEITSISTYALIASNGSRRAYEAGFKYIIAGSIASSIYLVGVIYLYRLTGSLSLDHHPRTGGSAIALMLLVTALLLELKPFPANGWSLDVYQAADPGISAMVSAVGASGVLFVLYKLTPLLSPTHLRIIAGSGAVTFVFSQLIALRQTDVRRMLGYSSTAQIGLMLLVIGSGRSMIPTLVLLGLLLGNHMLSKAGLFWITDLIDENRTIASMSDSASLPALARHKPLLVAMIGILLAALAGLPPFPSFWAKWYLISALVPNGRWLLVVVVLGGSLMEAGYLFRWFTRFTKSLDDPGDVHQERIPADVPVTTRPQTGTVSSRSGKEALARQAAATVATIQGTPRIVQQAERSVAISGSPIPTIIATLVLVVGGIAAAVGFLAPNQELVLLIPLLVLLIGTLLDMGRIASKIQLLMGMAGIGIYSWFLLPALSGISLVFGLIFLVGGLLQMIALMQRKGHQPGLAVLVSTLLFSLGNLLFAQSRLGLFFSWELMSIVSYLLIVRGRFASGAALRYLMFSLGGAYSILVGLMLLPSGFAPHATSSLWAGILLGTGFLIKIGTVGLHIWLPGAYAEAEDEISSLLSSVLSKAGLFMLFTTAGLFIEPLIRSMPGVTLAYILGWLGVLTALAGAFLALFQEDIKYTLAYSSMGQMGYMLLSFALMTQLGWINSMYLATTHLLFKTMLFIAIAGVVNRTGTRLMYRMGGLISRMPVTFFSVLIGIIALSGVPPLTGFGTKWMLYTALIEKGWYLQAGMAFFASAIAFLYLFRLIHSIFLGQLKDEHREIREAPVWYLIPQVIAIIGIMLVSMFPNLLIKPLEMAIAGYFPQTIAWDGYTMLSTLGYWNGNAVMYVTMGVFLVPLVWLLVTRRKHNRKVSQFNIVYSAERPDRPQTTHYAYNFFAPYRSALGSFLTPWATRFWERVLSVVRVVGSSTRRIYSGDGQTYALYVLLYAIVLMLLLRGGN